MSGKDKGTPSTKELPDGSLDATFGDGGKVATPLPGGAGGTAYTATLQPDGKIVAGGSYDFFQFAVARFKPHGGLDRTFSGDGFAITDVGLGAEQWVSGLVMRPSGKIMAAGSQGPHEGGDAPPRFVMVRYRANGHPDLRFGGGDGTIVTGFPDGVTASDAGVQADGKIIIVGTTGVSFALARYVA